MTSGLKLATESALVTLEGGGRRIGHCRSMDLLWEERPERRVAAHSVHIDQGSTGASSTCSSHASVVGVLRSGGAPLVSNDGEDQPAPQRYDWATLRLLARVICSQRRVLLFYLDSGLQKPEKFSVGSAILQPTPALTNPFGSCATSGGAELPTLFRGQQKQTSTVLRPKAKARLRAPTRWDK